MSQLSARPPTQASSRVFFPSVWLEILITNQVQISKRDEMLTGRFRRHCAALKCILLMFISLWSLL